MKLEHAQPYVIDQTAAAAGRLDPSACRTKFCPISHIGPGNLRHSVSTSSSALTRWPRRVPSTSVNHYKFAGSNIPVMCAGVRVSAALDASGRDRAVEQSGSALVVCENGMSLFVDVTWHHLGEGERFGVGVRGSKGTAAINPLTVWKELHGMAVDVSPTSSGSRENAFTASYRAEWAHFEAAVAGEAKVAPLQDHLVLHRILDAIYKSAEDGRDVVL